MTTNNSAINNKRRRFLLLMLLILFVLALGFLGFYFWQNSRLEIARRELDSPQVHIEHPIQGQHLATNQYSYVSVQAGSKNPIRSLELWIDGILIEIISSEEEEGSRQMGRVFDFLVEEGPHTIVARATDIKGSVGQSLPLSYTGDPPPSP